MIKNKYLFPIQIICTMLYVFAISYGNIESNWHVAFSIFLAFFWVMFINILTETYRVKLRYGMPKLKWGFKATTLEILGEDRYEKQI